MFSGIVEATAEVKSIESKGTNKTFTLINPFKEELYIDQSISHNGVCLTVTEINDKEYKVDAIQETLQRSNFHSVIAGDLINIERSISLNSRIDGHLVQGHVDTTGIIESVEQLDGSWVFTIRFPTEYEALIIEKGSICVNGISLTVTYIVENRFKVAIIPYTFKHTNLNQLKAGDHLNLEFDSIGKYVIKYLQKINS